MPTKRKTRNRQKTTPPDADSQRTPSKLSPVQRAVHNGQRELDNREYGEGYGASREAALCDQKPAEDQGATEGRSDTVEGALNNFPEDPPPALFEAKHLLGAATVFWGLEEGDIAGRSRKAEIIWPRYVCINLMRAKGMTLQSIGKLLGRDHTSIHNAGKQYNALIETLPAYKRQVAEFERYCWNAFKGLPPKRYKVGSVIT